MCRIHSRPEQVAGGLEQAGADARIRANSAQIRQSGPDFGRDSSHFLGKSLLIVLRCSLVARQADESRLAARAEGEQMLEAAEAAMEVSHLICYALYRFGQVSLVIYYDERQQPSGFGSSLLCPVSIRI